MAFYKRDGHVVELQLGKEVVDRPEDACSSPNYDQRLMPYETLVSEYSNNNNNKNSAKKQYSDEARSLAPNNAV